MSVLLNRVGGDVVASVTHGSSAHSDLALEAFSCPFCHSPVRFTTRRNIPQEFRDHMDGWTHQRLAGLWVHVHARHGLGGDSRARSYGSYSSRTAGTCEHLFSPLPGLRVGLGKLICSWEPEPYRGPISQFFLDRLAENCIPGLGLAPDVCGTDRQLFFFSPHLHGMYVGSSHVAEHKVQALSELLGAYEAYWGRRTRVFLDALILPTPMAPEPGDAWLVLEGRGRRKGNVAEQSRRRHARRRALLAAPAPVLAPSQPVGPPAPAPAPAAPAAGPMAVSAPEPEVYATVPAPTLDSLREQARLALAKSQAKTRQLAQKAAEQLSLF